MKNILFVFFLFVFVNNSFAQTEPPDIHFKDIEVNWSYISKDSNFVKSPVDKYSSPYWGRQPVDVLIDADGIYILELCVSQSPYGGAEGSLLFKLDASTGVPLWINHNNTYVGNDFRELYTIGSLRKLDDGNLEIFGYRDLDSIDFTQPQWWGFNGQPLTRKISDLNGMLLDLKISHDTIRELYNDATSGFNHLITLSDGNHIQLSRNLFFENGELINSLDLYDVDEISMRIDTPFFNRIAYHTGIPGYQFPVTYSIIPEYRSLGEDSLVITFATKDTLDDELSPMESWLQFYDLSRIDDIEMVKEIDLRPEIYFPQHPLNEDIQIAAKDKNLFVSQYCVENGTNKQFYWLAWYNDQGELMGKIDKMQDALGNYYDYFEPIGVRNETAFFAVRVNDFAYDIVRLTPDAMEFETLGNIELINTQDQLYIYILKIDFMPENKILVCMRLKIKNEQGYATDINYYLSFDEADLGIITSTNKVIAAKKDFNFYPNPADQYIQWEAERAMTGSLELKDILGKKWAVTELNKTTHCRLAIAHVPVGMYALTFKGPEGEFVSKKLIIER